MRDATGKNNKLARLRAAGWRVGDAEELLQPSEEDARILDALKKASAEAMRRATTDPEKSSTG